MESRFDFRGYLAQLANHSFQIDYILTMYRNNPYEFIKISCSSFMIILIQQFINEDLELNFME